MAEAKNVAKGAGSILAAIVVAITAGAKSCRSEIKNILKRPGPVIPILKRKIDQSGRRKSSDEKVKLPDHANIFDKQQRSNEKWKTH